ncbi:DNA glycosylase AlkZ-like family protein [Spirillospora sp. CA-294931]|uniref:DNA glycosylase AlkZ-like family protein n=1 Tax=Spirillospora sp. CA-294931 TaxID=3240042 RepID=UPI003D8CA58D
MDIVKVRAWWAHKQGLDGALHGTAPAEVLARTGWARSVGGVNPYLQLFGRARTPRERADAAMAALEIHELPSARGCMYVLPADDYAIGLKIGEKGPLADVALCEKLGVPRAEIDRLAGDVLTALDKAGAPLDPRELKNVLGDSVRNLGEAGKKKGLTTTLPVALGLLQATGEIRRVPPSGRFDQQRFGYVPWTPPAAPTAEEARAALAHRYWTWTGGAALKHFRWFSAFTAKDAKAAIEPLGLVPLDGDGDLLALPGDAAAYKDFVPPAEPAYSLLGWIDGVTLLRRDLPTVLDPADAARELPRALSGKRLGEVKEPPAQLIVDRGRMVGLWDYDPEAQKIVAASLVPRDDAFDEAVARTEEFVRDQLGDARGDSMDGPESRRPRLDALRSL